MTKQELIDLMSEYLTADNREGPADIEGKEELADAILEAYAEKTTEGWLEEGSLDIVTDTTPKFAFHKASDMPIIPGGDEEYTWTMKQAGPKALTCKHPLDRILYRGEDKHPICSACGLEVTNTLLTTQVESLTIEEMLEKYNVSKPTEDSYEWTTLNTNVPEEYMALKPFADFLADKCGVKDAEVYLGYYLGNITTE